MKKDHIRYIVFSVIVLLSTFIFPIITHWIEMNASAKDSPVLGWISQSLFFFWIGVFLPAHVIMSKSTANKWVLWLVTISAAIVFVVQILTNWKYSRQMAGCFLVTALFESLFANITNRKTSCI